MVDSPQEKERVLAARLLELADASAASEAFREVLRDLVPLVRKTVVGVARTWKDRHGAEFDPEDFAQEVLIRLSQSPPTSPQLGDPLFTVRSWIKTVTFRMLVSHRRRLTIASPDGRVARLRRVGEGSEQADDLDAVDPLPCPEENAETADLLEKVHEHLRDFYPLGCRYLEVLKDNPDASGAELAQALGVKRDNVYKIAERTRTVLSEFRRVMRLESEER